jgi:hypothetical protein
MAQRVGRSTRADDRRTAQNNEGMRRRQFVEGYAATPRISLRPMPRLVRRAGR